MLLGEQCQENLTLMCHAQGTLLVLDEPTNHLDIPSKEMLEEALQRFDGSVIAVSHDRYFLRRIATRVVTVRHILLPLPAVACPVNLGLDGFLPCHPGMR